jgi:hypothetical protein
MSPSPSSPIVYADRRSTIQKTISPFAQKKYNLYTNKLSGINKPFTDNNIYELNLKLFSSDVDEPIVISNRSYTSFVLFNVPDNNTLNATYGDTDNDGITDWSELFQTYTNPFLPDTDNDSINDYWENKAGSDPNNHTESFNVTWHVISSTINGSIYNISIRTWHVIDSTLNGTVYNRTAPWKVISSTLNGSIYNKTALWSVIDSTLNGTVYNRTVDITSPTIIINFAGNLSDFGGSYYRPPSKTIPLSGAWLNGYYTNHSYQSEDWIYINTTVNGTDSEPIAVKLHWYNISSGIWDNTTSLIRGGKVSPTYDFSFYYTINTSGIFNLQGGFEYSFDIWANDSTSTVYGATDTVLVFWNKTVEQDNIHRISVHLGCTPHTILYQPFYLYSMHRDYSDSDEYDILLHDQGTDGTQDDTGYMESSIPSNNISLSFCSGFLAY